MVAKQELPVSARDPVRFTPSDFEESDPKRPVYLISAATLTAKARWERDRAAEGASPIPLSRIRAHLRDAVNALLKGKAKKDALRDLDLVDEAEQATGAPDEKELAERLAVVRRVAELGDWAAAHWPPYAEIAAQTEYAWKIAQILAAKHFLVGWERVTVKCTSCKGSGKLEESLRSEDSPPDAPCARCEGKGRVPLKYETNGSGLVSEAALEEIPRAHVFEIAMKALSLMRVDSERRKN